MTMTERRQCEQDERCQYAAGHYGDCTTVEVGKHVLQMRESNHAHAYRARLDAVLSRVKAVWLDELVQDGRSPLLIVGWVSVKAGTSGYRQQLASTWHRDRDCKRNRAMGRLVPRLYMETGTSSSSVTPCAGCGQLDEEQKRQAARDWRRLRELQWEATEGLCRGPYDHCGREVVPGKTTCEKDAKTVTAACYDGRHEECDNILATHTRQDGSTYTTRCDCKRCYHRVKK